MGRARPVCRHPEEPPSAAVLEAVARFWAEGRTGYVRWTGGEARLVGGEPPTGEDLQALVSGLYQESLPRFLTTDIELEKPGGHLANELWFAALKAVDRGALKGRGKDNLVPGPAQRWGSKLPLRYATQKLVDRVLKEEVLLRSTMEIPREVRREVLDEVCALLLMGVLYLQTAERTQALAPTDLLSKLEADWARIQSSDDWSLFDIEPGGPDLEHESAFARVIGHYQAHEVDPRTPKEGQAHARRIVKRLHRAMENIRNGRALGPADEVSAEDGFAEGMLRLKAEAYAEAAKCFAKANKRFPGQPRNAAWMAFAIYKDASRPAATRKHQAIELAQKVAQVDQKGDALYVLARIAYDGGDHLDAWTQLGRLLGLNPRHRKGRRLYEHVSQLLEGSVDVEGMDA